MASNVFINCPFDTEYRECFEAIVFACYACGFRPRSALSSSSKKVLRFSALRDLVAACDVGIHDLSRTQLDLDGRPRFNMPFELGFFLGAKEFGGKRNRSKHTLVMVKERHAMGAYLSDLAGLDPLAHGDDPRRVIKHVRDTLAHFLTGTAGPGAADPVLPGPLRIIARFQQFKRDLAAIAEQRDFDMVTFNVLDAHLDFCLAVEAFLTGSMPAPRRPK